MATVSERSLIEMIRATVVTDAPGLLQGIGDDCAVFESGSSPWLVSTDTLVDRVHFERSFHPPKLLGRKSMAVNLSDVAAMGGRPRFALLSLSLPPNLSSDWLNEYLAGVRDILGEYDCVLIGGDTVTSAELAFSVTVLGQSDAGPVLYRSEAGEGDIVMVSGPLGSSAAGLAILQRDGGGPQEDCSSLIAAHLDPIPQVQLGLELAASGFVTAMQDISDGLATDLAHICRESSVSALVHASQLPRLPELSVAAEYLNRTPLDWMLKGGEDYQLVFTVRAGLVPALQDILRKKGLPAVVEVGVIRSGSGVYLETGEDQEQEITFQGFEHLPDD
ncbi:MAG: thiamine-phosphate kinase [Desulfobulbaceae bacterium]|uniref:Thiamine-monophosphate kinase n=1 Tax=Candidatus Desulfatifera sulfidica TaxID=2841691 RepID=A0A8J6NCR7_9BACT|nr:thiamine-phosphate kinase [Candidatus Desulfatifera sulfidica]